MAGETEEEIYATLGLAWIPPELRENQGEIDAAAANNLPELVEVRYIRGDIHMHTTETDGRATLEEMAAAAKGRGYEYIAITDHSKALAMANGLDEARAVAFAQRVREINRNGLGIQVFSGIECDIRRDGVMDLADRARGTGFRHRQHPQLYESRTDRNDGPLIARPGMPLSQSSDIPQAGCYFTGRASVRFRLVSPEAARRGVCLEINASPERLDLYSPLLRIAKAKGARFTISTDAHHPKHLANMRLGVK